jgi:lipopolysaccharide biosynthesis glycosyltransferase
MKKIAILGVTDEKYLKRYVMAFDSLLANTKAEFDFFILTENTSVEEEDLISYFFSSVHGKPITYLKMTDEQKHRAELYPKHQPTQNKKHISEVTMHKWMGLELLKDAGYDAAIYFDPDVLFVKNTDDYFTIAEELELIAGVPHDPSALKSNFATGMMIVNLTALTDDMSKEYDDLVIANNGKHYDHMIINAMFSDKYKPLDQKYNRTTNMTMELKDDTVMIHFVGPDKPWNAPSSLNFVKDRRISVYRDAVVKRMRNILQF